ncbi:neurohypophysial n-terminal domain containing protein [Stylonychia lemnae]|uniref:Neurohypophysial n-terminal domain containing protein n=1 Tax=Stylonychia lemnae TaxID=5949 RepID=A0A078B3L2_STYLE|nr:neurohypophysial n-terminal domain containing protein [Stylonychia lemnae]|eukprot:CDW88093.1 neurohypophysial n-terminal domain containing protein [Stylonychia lemnae]
MTLGIYEDGEELSKDIFDGGWTNVQISFSQSNSTWIFGRDRYHQYSRKLSQTYPHPKQICMWQINAYDPSIPKPQGSQLSGWTASMNNNLKATFTDQSVVSWQNTNTEDNYCYKSDCPKGQFFNETSKVCQICPSPCSSCDYQGKCLYCKASYNYINNGSNLCLSIVDGCPENTTTNEDGQRICQACPEGCKNARIVPRIAVVAVVKIAQNVKMELFLIPSQAHVSQLVRAELIKIYLLAFAKSANRIVTIKILAIDNARGARIAAQCAQTVKLIVYNAGQEVCTQIGSVKTHVKTKNMHQKLVLVTLVIHPARFARKCPVSYYPNSLTLTCEPCKYYCEDCNNADDCNILLPFNAQTIPSEFDPEELTSELWFKAKDLTSLNIQVLLGLNPYKIRKISKNSLIQLQYQNTLQYCNSDPALTNNVWYHIAFTLSQKNLSMACYQDGNSIPVGLNPTIVVVQNLMKPQEMILGGSNDLQPQETNFDGYIKEFRLWKIVRSSYQIKHFRTVSFTKAPPEMIAYWRLDNKNDGSTSVFSEATSSGVTNYDPRPIHKIQDLVELREIYLKLCAEGSYSYFNDILGYQSCLPCNKMCKNCIGKTSSHCIECNLPYKLIKEEFICKIVDYCPEGEYMDKVLGLCFKCNINCKACFGDQNNCSACKYGAFREFEGKSCVDTCPAGMYGNIKTQLCYFNPRVDYIIPTNESIIYSGSFIDVKGNFTMLNKEANGSYQYGWKVIRLSDNLDITADAVKPYFETDIRKMHLDNNIVQDYNYYSITLFVKGFPEIYNGLYSEMVNIIYIGSAPRNGKCQVYPAQGIATVTKFKIQQSGWVDKEIITRYDFLYSLDGGIKYFPIQSDDRLSQEISYLFQSIYDKFIQVRIMCKATNLKGFTSKISTIIVLEKKSNADASKDLNNLKPSLVESEVDILQMIIQLKLITKQLGNVKFQDPQAFDPRLLSQNCNNKLCSYNGKCVYLDYQKKYYCNCTQLFAGLNCSYSNETQLSQIKSFISQLSLKYLIISDKEYEDVFLNLVTDYFEIMNDVTYGIIIQTIGNKLNLNGYFPLTDNEVSYYLNLLSNLIEYIEQQTVYLNATGQLLKDQIMIQNLQDNYQSALDLFEYLRQNTLNQIGMLDPKKQFQSRMISYKQILISQDTLQSFSATQDLKKSITTFIKISEINFENQSLPLEVDFVFEAVEFAVNPYQVINTNNISNNVFEINFYNASDKAKAEIKDLKHGFDFYFPFQDNQNLSDFISYYNSLSPYKSKQKELRVKLLQSSKLGCLYWNGNQWSNQGCQLQDVDRTHIKCKCNHLSSFSTTFMTPKQSSISNEIFTNKYSKANSDDDDNIKVEELIVTFDKYFKNLEELLQHKTPSLIDFLFKPGMYIVIVFWFMYISSLFYYTGKDKIKRAKMTKSLIRDDLAEIKDDQIQCLDEMIKELLARDLNQNQFSDEQHFETLSQHTRQNSQEEKLRLNIKRMSLIGHTKSFLSSSLNVTLDNLHIPTLNNGIAGNSQIYSAKNYQQLDQYAKKVIKRRARKRVFGRVGDVNDRALRIYKQIFKRKQYTPENKMKFFHEALRNNLWFSLMSKTSKIAPRHIRLTLMYLYISIHLTITSVVYIFGYQQIVADFIGDSTFSTIAIAILPLIGAWIICLPVALIFRMPMAFRRELEGIRSKKINKVFKEIDKQMGCRYALGYFICYTFYVIMSIIVLFFNYIYPTDYCMGWMMILVALFFLDMIVFTLGFAGFQLLNIILSLKCRFFYHVWALFEIIRYYKNLRG